MKVVTMRQKSLENSIEKSDQNSVDGMRHEVYSKGKWRIKGRALDATPLPMMVLTVAFGNKDAPTQGTSAAYNAEVSYAQRPLVYVFLV